MKQVLLLDDSPDQLLIRGEILRRVKIDSQGVEAAEDALELLRQPGGTRFGVVVTDHLMPGMTGAEFVRQLRRFSRDLPVIVMSGLPDAEAEYSGMSVLFVLKPCEPDRFVELIRSALEFSERKASA
jgi:DNA-binding NtrC family response regulator